MNETSSKNHSVIIGGSSGIGRSLAERLSQHDDVSVIARRKPELDELSNNYGVTTIQADVNNFDQIHNAIIELVKINGKINKLVYCAGLQIIKPHRLMAVSEFDDLYNVNLRGALILSKLFCSAKISEKNSVFCSVSSIASINPEPGIITYSSMKAALDNMIKGLAKEYGPRRFVAVSPGWLETEMTQKQPLYNDAFKESLKANSPLGITSVNDVVEAILFVISKKASSITGEILTVDSGSSL